MQLLSGFLIVGFVQGLPQIQWPGIPRPSLKVRKINQDRASVIKTIFQTVESDLDCPNRMYTANNLWECIDDNEVEPTEQILFEAQTRSPLAPRRLTQPIIDIIICPTESSRRTNCIDLEKVSLWRVVRLRLCLSLMSATVLMLILHQIEFHEHCRCSVL